MSNTTADIGKRNHLRRNKNVRYFVITILTVLMILAVSSVMKFREGITGYASAEIVHNYSDAVRTTFNESSEFMWQAVSGRLKSVKIDGGISYGTSAQVYLEGESYSYLIYDSGYEESSGLQKITTFTPEDVIRDLISFNVSDTNKTIFLRFDYGNGASNQ